jgi:hypothetical protein
MTIQQVSCMILDLELDPPGLTLLGLKIHSSKIDLVTTATPGGRLPGELQCAIAGLLCGGLINQLTRLVNLINQVLALFR